MQEQILKAEVNKILVDTFDVAEIKNDSAMWDILAKAVYNFNVEQADFAMFMACYYILLNFKSSASGGNNNTESLKMGSVSYEGGGFYSVEVTTAQNILETLGYININIGVVN